MLILAYEPDYIVKLRSTVMDRPESLFPHGDKIVLFKDLIDFVEVVLVKKSVANVIIENNVFRDCEALNYTAGAMRAVSLGFV